MGRRRGHVSYVITTSGPQPADGPHDPLDHEHYLDKQVRAVAEPVLTLLGLDFDHVIGAAKQLSLF
jgi:DNA polymerase-2